MAAKKKTVTVKLDLEALKKLIQAANALSALAAATIIASDNPKVKALGKRKKSRRWHASFSTRITPVSRAAMLIGAPCQSDPKTSSKVGSRSGRSPARGGWVSSTRHATARRIVPSR